MTLENGRQVGSKMSIQGTVSRESLLVFVVRFLVKDELEEVKSVFLNKIKDEVGQVVGSWGFSSRCEKLLKSFSS